MFAILSSYLKEPQLIIASLTPGSVTSRIPDTETLEGRLQEVETQPRAHTLGALISTRFQLMDSTCRVGEEGRLRLSTPRAGETEILHSFL